MTCPGCGAPLTGASTCPSCALPLVGPVAARLWQVDQRLTAVEAEGAALVAEHERLVTALRTGAAVGADPFVPSGAPAGGAAFFATVPQPQGTVPRKESSPQQVQNTLLSLGALLLAVAGIVFAAVTYQHLGPVGRAAILLLVTAVAGGAPVLLARRRLTDSAEAVAAVAIVLAVVDGWALRRAGLARDVDVRSFWAVATALLCLLAFAYAMALPLRVSRFAAVAFGQLPVVFVLARTDAPRPVIAVALAALAALDLVIASELRLPSDVRGAATVFAALSLVTSLLATVAAVQQHARGAGAGLVAVAIVLAAGSTRVTDARQRAVLSGTTVPLLAAAAWVTARGGLSHPQRPLLLVAVALIAVAIGGLLPRAHRDGPTVGGLVVLLAGLLTQAEAVVVGIAGPVTWLAQPWTLSSHASRVAVSVDKPWSGTVITLAVLAAAASCVAGAGLLLDRFEDALLPTALLATLALLVLPLSMAMSYDWAVRTLVLLAAAGGGLALTQLADRLHWSLFAAATAFGLLAAVWSVADRQTTLVTLPVLAVLAAALSLRAPAAAGVAAVLTGSAVAAYGADAALARAEVGGLLLLIPALALGLAAVLGGVRRVSLEAAALVLAAASVVLAVEDLQWLSLTLAGSGLLALGTAIRPDRRELALVGGLLLSASSWVRLADAHVHAPEPYAAPLAITALLFGHLRRRGDPRASSFQAYGPGLSVALVPTLVRSLADDSATRGLLLLAVCVLVVLAGAHWRLRAPLVIGGGVLVLDALHLMTPFARALPRWSLLAVAGAVLVGAGATYEQRRRDLTRLRVRYDSLT